MRDAAPKTVTVSSPLTKQQEEEEEEVVVEI